MVLPQVGETGVRYTNTGRAEQGVEPKARMSRSTHELFGQSAIRLLNVRFDRTTLEGLTLVLLELVHCVFRSSSLWV